MALFYKSLNLKSIQDAKVKITPLRRRNGEQVSHSSRHSQNHSRIHTVTYSFTQALSHSRLQSAFAFWYLYIGVFKQSARERFVRYMIRLRQFIAGTHPLAPVRERYEGIEVKTTIHASAKVAIILRKKIRKN